MIQGILYIVSAPSGTGKSSLINALLNSQTIYKAQISISHTTRAMRTGEINGIHYFFVTKTEFKRMIDENAFLEYALVFGNYYGTLRKNIDQTLTDGTDIFLDIDWQGAQQIRKKIPEARSIFILPPSKKELDIRLCKRGQDSQEVITQRIANSTKEIIHLDEYDYVIINEDFDTALLDLKTVVCAERLRIKHQKSKYKDLINTLIAK